MCLYELVPGDGDGFVVSARRRLFDFVGLVEAQDGLSYFFKASALKDDARCHREMIAVGKLLVRHIAVGDLLHEPVELFFGGEGFGGHRRIILRVWIRFSSNRSLHFA